jgi:DNA invertase Pin-like site-specific DNA recombinase
MEKHNTTPKQTTAKRTIGLDLGDRSAFRQMMYDASIRKWDLLVFWSLDRFTREGMLATL